MRIAFIVLEIACPPSHDTRRLHAKAVQDLKRSIFSGFPVLGVIDTDTRQQPTEVPCYGHDYACRCEDPQPWGVHRFFGYTLVLDGEPSATDIIGRYSLGGRAEVEIVGLVLPDESEKIERKRIESKQPAYRGRPAR